MDWTPVLISLRTAGVAIVFTFVLGILAAWFVITRRRKAVKVLLDGLFILPMVLPPTVAGFFLLYIFGVRRPVGAFLIEYFGIRIAFSWGATVLAAVVMSFPLMYKSARAAFEQVDNNLLQAARTIGMSESRIFFRVLLANSLPGVIGGGILAFLRGLGEFGATAMIAGNIHGKTETLPLAIYSDVAAGDMASAKGYVIVLLLVAFIAVALMDWVENCRKRRPVR